MIRRTEQVPPHRSGGALPFETVVPCPLATGVATAALLATSSVASATPPEASGIRHHRWTSESSLRRADGRCPGVAEPCVQAMRPICSSRNARFRRLPTRCPRACADALPSSPARWWPSVTEWLTTPTTPCSPLPDGATLHGSANHRPMCDQIHACVLLVGPADCDRNPVWLALWSRQFFVDPASPGTGTPEVPFALSCRLMAFAIFGGTILIRRRRSSRAIISARP